jgi:hypothetical protein
MTTWLQIMLDRDLPSGVRNGFAPVIKRLTRWESEAETCLQKTTEYKIACTANLARKNWI